jgi:deoxycytidylate deaminase
MTSPDQCHIDTAIYAAARSICRSKRGVALFNARTGAHRGDGHNGPPAPFTCPGREACTGTCGKRCVHAEMRALRAGFEYGQYHDLDDIELIHVELTPDGSGVVACDGPKCWQCSREIVDVGFVKGVWLYELSGEQQRSAFTNDHGHWRRYSAEEFHRVTLERCGMVP